MWCPAVVSDLAGTRRVRRNSGVAARQAGAPPARGLVVSMAYRPGATTGSGSWPRCTSSPRLARTSPPHDHRVRPALPSRCATRRPERIQVGEAGWTSRFSAVCLGAARGEAAFVVRSPLTAERPGRGGTRALRHRPPTRFHLHGGPPPATRQTRPLPHANLRHRPPVQHCFPRTPPAAGPSRFRLLSEITAYHRTTRPWPHATAPPATSPVSLRHVGGCACRTWLARGSRRSVGRNGNSAVRRGPGHAWAGAAISGRNSAPDGHSWQAQRSRPGPRPAARTHSPGERSP